MKSILVTGAYGGMGSATVRALKSAGFRVFALDRQTGEAEENVIPVIADITDSGSVSAAYETVRRETDNLCAIIHFAGIYMLDSLVEVSDDAYRKAFEVNVFGAFLINKTFMPLLGKGSRIIITTSELAPLSPLPFTGIYAVTKSALDKYAYSLRMELQLLGITVSVVRAGAVDTGMLGVSTDALGRFTANTQLYSYNAGRFKRIVDGVEAKRIPPEKLAAKVLKILTAKNPRFAYTVNRNPLLLAFGVLPSKLQLFLIKKILEQ